jgi:hypothetical protein
LLEESHSADIRALSLDETQDFVQGVLRWAKIMIIGRNIILINLFYIAIRIKEKKTVDRIQNISDWLISK